MEFFERNVERFYSGTGTPADPKAAEDCHRLQQRVHDLEKQLALRHDANTQLDATLAGMKAQLERVEEECASLRQSMESSLALRAARLLPPLPAGLRSLFTKGSHSIG